MKHETEWSTNKKGEWNEHKEVTENIRKCDGTLMENSTDIDKELRKPNEIYNKSKNKAFGEIKVKRKARTTP